MSKRGALRLDVRRGVGPSQAATDTWGEMSEGRIEIGQSAEADSLARLIGALAEAIIQGRGNEARALRAHLAEALSKMAPQPLPVWPRVTIAELPPAPGIYVITSVEKNEHYVGLALNLRDRFHDTTYGHLAAASRTRARSLVRSGAFAIRLPHVLDRVPVDVDAVALSRLEIETYVSLVLGGARTLNSLAMLGRVGETEGIPVTLCECDTDSYLFSDSLSAASRLVTAPALRAAVYGYQRTAGGYAVRWSTQSEIESLKSLTRPHSILVGPVVRDAVARDASDVQWTGQGRNGSFRWIAGLLSESDRERLGRYRRGDYTRREPSGYFAVAWNERNKAWQCRAKTALDPRKLWITGHRTWTPLDAAIAREEKIRAEGWQAFNSGRYGSNADLINAALGQQRFRPW